MSRNHLKNYHLEPETNECTCTIDHRCGGITEVNLHCPEHSGKARASDLMKSHFHPIQAIPRISVGTHARF